MDDIEVDPASPCQRQCQLSPRRVCTGCGRTVEEISGWRSMTVSQQRQCVEDAAARLDLVDMEMD
jgi:predicted Fe-S protein YdhL (DUF1289 family)